MTRNRDSIVVGGRRVDAAYDHTNSALPSGIPLPVDERFRTFALDRSPTDDQLPVILGEGALFGPVVSATLADGQPVAVKTYLSLREGADNRSLAQTAQHEYRRGADDLGPHFVRARALLESLDHEAQSMFLLVMDRVSGHTLESVLGELIPVATQRKWLSDALQALKIMAENKLIQQDVKPANIMATPRGLVFIDHGSTRAGLAATHTNDQRTLAYLAPEYFTTDTFTTEVMIFGIGLTLFELFTEGHPYSEPEFNIATTTDPRDLLRRTRRGTLNLSHPSVDPQVVRVLALMTSTNPRDRARVLAPDFSAPTEPINPRPTSRATQPTETRVTQEVRSAELRFEPIDEAADAEKPRSRNPGDLLEVELLPLTLPDDQAAPSSWWIDHAGVNSKAVHVDHERRNYRYIGVGLAVYRIYIIMGVLALVHQMSDSWRVAIVAAATVGPVLGQALVNFDRSIVSAIRPKLTDLRSDAADTEPLRGGWQYWVNIGARVVATILIAFLVGSAVDVQIHQKDIMPVLAEKQQDMRKALDQEVEKAYGADLADARAAIATAESARKAAADLSGELLQRANDERLGVSGTGTAGCGPVCTGLLNDSESARKQYLAQLPSLNADVTAAEGALAKVTEKVDAFKAPKLAQIDQATGPIAQAKALLELALRDWFTLLTSLALIATFMVIELFPVIMKVATSGNNYEVAQARRARLASLIDLENTATYRAYVLDAAGANRGLQTNLVAVRAAEQTMKLEDAAENLYRGRQALAPHNGQAAQPGAGTSPAHTPTLAMLTRDGRDA